MMGHVPYSKYAMSNATAVPQLPSHWTSKRLRYVCSVNPSKSEISLPADASVSFIPMDAVGEYGGISLDYEKPIDEIGTGYTYFVDDDVVIAKITPCFENGKGAIAKSLVNGVAFGTTELHVLRATSEIAPRFLFYISISDHFRKLGESEMYGAGGQKRVPESFIKNFRAAIPPLPEQAVICSFLDREIARIDALVAKKERFLEFLEEERLAVITHAIVKGLNPSASTRNSGIEWLGQIPGHWQLKKIKYTVSNVVDCLHTTPNYDGELFYPAVRTADIERGRLLLDQVRLVSKEVYQERIERLRPIEGDILYSREGERFGLAALVPGGVELCLGQRMMMFRSLPDMAPAYLMWALNSKAVYQQVVLYTGGATSPHINISDIINFYIPCPPRDEQFRIADHILAKCSKLDVFVNGLRAGIQKLQVYRSALITNAVTGKIDVPELERREAAA